MHFLKWKFRQRIGTFSPYMFTSLHKATDINLTKNNLHFVAEEADPLHKYIPYIFFSERGPGTFSVTSNKELMIIVDVNNRQHSVPWPHGATGLSQGEQCHLLNQQNCFMQWFCGRLSGEV